MHPTFPIQAFSEPPQGEPAGGHPEPTAPPLPPEAPAHEPMVRIPPVTGWLIGLNVAVHLARSFLPPEQDDVVVSMLGFDPARLVLEHDPAAIGTLITYQFLHGGWEHLLLNMISLLAFGPGIERPLGRIRFLVLYLLCGVAGALVETAFSPLQGDDLMVGASAGISGVFGAILVLWRINRPGARQLGLLPMAAIWIVLLAVTGMMGVGSPDAPVAWIAHIGGFIAGMILGALFKRSLLRR